MCLTLIVEVGFKAYEHSDFIASRWYSSSRFIQMNMQHFQIGSDRWCCFKMPLADTEDRIQIIVSDIAPRSIINGESISLRAPCSDDISNLSMSTAISRYRNDVAIHWNTYENFPNRALVRYRIILFQGDIISTIGKESSGLPAIAYRDEE